MTTLEWNETRIPDGEDASEDTSPSSDLACQVCGRPLVYSGRGRKPRFCEDHKPSKSQAKRPATRTSADVNQALAVMDQFYRGAGFLIYLMSTKPADYSTPRASHEWNEVQVPRLLAADREIFTADPKLCAQINKLGGKGGFGMFIAVHAMAIFPVYQLLSADIRERQLMYKAARQAAREAESAAQDANAAADRASQFMPTPDVP